MFLKEYLPNQTQRKWFYFVMSVLFLFYPYILVDAVLPFFKSDILQYFVFSILLFSINIFKSKRANLPIAFWLVVTIMVIGSMVSFFVSGSKFYYHRLIYMFCSVNLIMIVQKQIGLVNFYRVYNRWILIMAALGVFGFLIAFVGVKPFFEFEALNDGRTVSSWIITFTKLDDFPVGSFIRYSGFFDEPGAIGYWGMFTLAINRLFIKDLKLEKILLVLLLFTFSMGFISQAIFFVAFFYLIRGGGRNKIIMGIILSILVVGVIATKNTQYSMIYDSTIGRFEEASKATEFMEGTTREFNTQLTKEEWERSPIWGIGWKIDGPSLSDNAYETLAHDGIVGTVYLYFPYILLLYLGIKRRDIDVIGVTIFCALAIFHRPIHANLLTYFIFYSLPAMYAMKTNLAVKNDNI